MSNVTREPRARAVLNDRIGGFYVFYECQVEHWGEVFWTQISPTWCGTLETALEIARRAHESGDVVRVVQSVCEWTFDE